MINKQRMYVAPSQMPFRFLVQTTTLAVFFLILSCGYTEKAKAVELPSTRLVDGLAQLGQFGPYLRLNHQAVEGIGNDESFTSLGAFQPLWHTKGLWFTDAQLLIDNDAHLGGNLGFGYRVYNPNSDRILGGSIWYDIDDRHANTFQQVGFALESLGDRWDVRFNGYFPVGDIVKSTSATAGGATNVHFEGIRILGDTFRLDEVALNGIDFELARRLGEYNFWGFGGTYHYEGEGESFWGAIGGVRGFVTDNLAAQVAISNSQLFGTDVFFRVTWFFGGLRGRRASPYQISDRLILPVERNSNLVVKRRAGGGVADVLASAATGDPITVIHVNSNAAPDGDGSVETPFQTLFEAQTGSAPYDIIFVHADSVFNGEGIALQANQRFLGEAIDHDVNTMQAGLIGMPRATAGTVVPVIQNTPGSALVLAHGTEVSGFTINNTGDHGIRGSDLSGDLVVDRIALNTITGNGISILRASGNVTVIDTAIATATGIGLNLDQIGGTATVRDNTIDGSGSIGMRLYQVAGGAEVSGNAVTNSGNTGVEMHELGSNTSINDNIISNSFWYGMNVDQVAGDITSTGNSISNSAREAATFFNITGNVAFSDNSISVSGAEGVFFQFVDGSLVCNNNTIESAGANGMFAVVVGGDVTATGNVIRNSSGLGARFGTIGGSVLFNNNTVQNSNNIGVLLLSVNNNVACHNNTVLDSINGGFNFQTINGNVVCGNNLIERTTGNGIALFNVSGIASLTENTVSDSGSDGIAGNSIIGLVTCTDNTVTNSGNSGISMWATGGGSLLRNNVSISTNNGIRFVFTTSAINCSGNTVAGSGADGFQFYQPAGRIDFVNNSVNNSTAFGAWLQPGVAVSATYHIENNAFVNNNGVGNAVRVSTPFGHTGVLNVNLIGNSSDDDYEIERLSGSLQYYDGGQSSGSVINIGSSATEVFTPFP